MPRILRLLLIVSILWSGAHVWEPALAHDETAHHQLAAEAGPSPDESMDGHAGPLDAAHGGHHHCPLAPDQGHASAPDCASPGQAPPFAAPAAQLDSLSQAPPLEPPAA